MRNDIINVIEDDRLKEAEELLFSYEAERGDSGNVEKQFCLFMRAQILQHKETDDREIFEVYEKLLWNMISMMIYWFGAIRICLIHTMTGLLF